MIVCRNNWRYKSAKMLHRKKGFDDSRFMYEYVNFPSLERALNFTPRLSLCQKWFPIQNASER